MYNVIFPTNFSSENKEVVTEFINKFTPTLNVEINYYLVHAYQIPSMGQNIMVDLNDSLEANAKEDMANYMADIKKNIPSDIKIDSYIHAGSFQSVLHRLGTEIDINLLVLIETKNSIYKEVLTESNLSTLSESLGEPIFFIPSNPEYVVPEKVVFATDLQPFENMKDFHNFLGFVKNSNARLEFLHVAKKENAEHFKKFETIFKPSLEQYGLQDAPLVIVSNDEVNKAIINFIETDNPQMIALVERGGGFFQRWFVSQTVDFLSNYDKLPLFVINEKVDQGLRKNK